MRTARKRSETGYYHVVNRGNNRQAIFGDDVDRLNSWISSIAAGGNSVCASSHGA